MARKNGPGITSRLSSQRSDRFELDWNVTGRFALGFTSAPSISAARSFSPIALAGTIVGVLAGPTHCNTVSMHGKSCDIAQIQLQIFLTAGAEGEHSSVTKEQSNHDRFGRNECRCVLPCQWNPHIIYVEHRAMLALKSWKRVD